MLDEKFAGDPRNTLRVTVRCVGKPVTLEESTCLRYHTKTEETGKGLVIEMLQLDGAYLSETQSEQLKRWVRRVPIDGRTYKFSEVGNG